MSVIHVCRGDVIHVGGVLPTLEKRLQFLVIQSPLGGFNVLRMAIMNFGTQSGESTPLRSERRDRIELAALDT